MPAYLFITGYITPALSFLAIGLVFAVPLLAVWDFLLETRQVKQEEAPQAEAPPQEVQQQPELAQRIRFCPYCDVHEEASWVAYDAWQKEIRQ